MLKYWSVLRSSMMAGITPMTSSQPDSVIRGGRMKFRNQRSQPVRERMNPLGRAFELLVQIGFALKHQLNDDLGGPEQQAVGQPVKNAAEQAEEKPPAIRPDKAPEFLQKIGHALHFCQTPRKVKVLFSLAVALQASLASLPKAR